MVIIVIGSDHVPTVTISYILCYPFVNGLEGDTGVPMPSMYFLTDFVN